MIEQYIIDGYLNAIYTDYINWGDKTSMGDEFRAEFNQEFKDGLRAIRGKKYIKIVAKHSVHSFIVNAPDAKFKIGDVLMAASYSAPARNHARGNVLDGTARITWTGANYII